MIPIDYVFKCKKCGNVIYINIIQQIIGYDCPNCKEVFEENWIFMGMGVNPLC